MLSEKEKLEEEKRMQLWDQNRELKGEFGDLKARLDYMDSLLQKKDQQLLDYE